MPRHRVLIVEDEHDIAGLIKHTLERTGDTEAHVVSSGDAALKAVAEEPPDLIILDLNLPVVSGVEVCRILRSRSDARHVPIITKEEPFGPKFPLWASPDVIIVTSCSSTPSLSRFITKNRMSPSSTTG